MTGGNKEGGIPVTAEVMAEDLEGADGIAKGARYLTGGQALDKESAKGLIDTLLGGARLEEKLRHSLMSFGVPLDMQLQYYMPNSQTRRIALIDSYSEPSCVIERCLCAEPLISPKTVKAPV